VCNGSGLFRRKNGQDLGEFSYSRLLGGLVSRRMIGHRLPAARLSLPALECRCRGEGQISARTAYETASIAIIVNASEIIRVF
jgi:hypothetical protein